MLERKLEQLFVKIAKSHGYHAYKWQSQTTRGVPDRILIMPGGIVHFVELKTSTGRLSKLQKHIGDELEALSCNYHVLYGREQVEKFFEELSQ